MSGTRVRETFDWPASCAGRLKAWPDVQDRPNGRLQADGGQNEASDTDINLVVPDPRCSHS